MSANLTALELGAFINVVYPILVGAITLILFIIVSVAWNSRRINLWLAIIAVTANLLTGIIIRFVDY